MASKSQEDLLEEGQPMYEIVLPKMNFKEICFDISDPNDQKLFSSCKYTSENVWIRVSSRNPFIFLLNKDKTKTKILPSRPEEDAQVGKSLARLRLKFSLFNEKNEEDLKLFLRMIFRAIYFGKLINHAFLILPSDYDEQRVKEITEAAELFDLEVKIDFFDVLIYYHMKNKYQISDLFEANILHFDESMSYVSHIVYDIDNDCANHKFIEKNKSIGGEIFDEALANYLIEDYQKENKIKLEKYSEEYKILFSKLKKKAEIAKRQLNSEPYTIIHGTYLKEINKSLFNKICAQEIQKTIRGLIEMIEINQFQKYLILTGSSFNIPNMFALIEEYIFEKPTRAFYSENLDEVIRDAVMIKEQLKEQKFENQWLIQAKTVLKMKTSYIQKVGGSSYFLLSILLILLIPYWVFALVVFVLLVFRLIIYVFLCFCGFMEKSEIIKQFSSFARYFQIFIKTTMGFLLSLPGILVIALQIICISYLVASEMESVNNLIEVKMGILMIYLCMVFSEISTGVDTLFYSIKIASWFHNFWFKTPAICFGVLPSIIQIGISYVLFLISIKLIFSAVDIVSLITNFAGLYAILQFDDIMMMFMDFFPFRIMLDKLFKMKIEKNQNFYDMLSRSPEKLSESVLKVGDFEFNYNESFCECEKNAFDFDEDNCNAGWVSTLAVAIKILLVLGLVICFYTSSF